MSLAVPWAAGLVSSPGIATVGLAMCGLVVCQLCLHLTLWLGKQGELGPAGRCDQVGILTLLAWQLLCPCFPCFSAQWGTF